MSVQRVNCLTFASARLLRLRCTPVRLEDATRTLKHNNCQNIRGETLARDKSTLVKSLASNSGTLQNLTARRDSVQTSDPFISASCFSRTQIDINRRYSAASSLREFKSAYIDLYPDLENFTQDFAKNLIRPAPKVLQNVTVIPVILKPKDIDTNSQDVKKLIEKFLYTQLGFELIMKYGCHYVRHDKRGWFRSQIQNVGYKFGHAMDALAALMMSDIPQESFLTVGAAGLNTGVQSSGISYENANKLADLQFFFENGVERKTR